MELYRNIKRLRVKYGLSQEELAHRLGYKSRTTICKIEAGAIDIPQSKIAAFATALNTTPGELMGVGGISSEASIDHPVIQQAKNIAEHQAEMVKDFLKTLCKDNPEAMEILDNAKITTTGELHLPDVSEVSQAVINAHLKTFVDALKNAKKNPDGTATVTYNPNK